MLLLVLGRSEPADRSAFPDLCMLAPGPCSLQFDARVARRCRALRSRHSKAKPRSLGACFVQVRNARMRCNSPETSQGILGDIEGDQDIAAS